MRRNRLAPWGKIIAAATLLGVGCAKETPDPPKRLNPLDPATEVQGGDPFRLAAELQGSAVVLTWTAPGMTEIAGWIVLRSEWSLFEEPDTLGAVDVSTTSYLDEEAAPGQRYYYKVLARDEAGRISSGSHLAVVSLETSPILQIDGDTQFTGSRRVALSVLASEADSMRIANDSTFAGCDWELYENQVTDWLLSAGEGPKIVYLQIMYTDGRLSPTVMDTTYREPIADCAVLSEEGTAYFRNLTTSLIVRSAGADSLMIRNTGDPEPALWTPLPVGSDSLLLQWEFPGTEGWKDIVVRCKDDFLVEVGPDTIPVAVDLSPPVALFDVSPPDSARGFTVDASASYDSLGVTPGENLLFAWQWDEGESWTPWATERTAAHTYGVFGSKTIRLIVKDGAGRTDTLACVFTAVNRAPAAPARPFPADGSADRSLLPRLSWGESEDVEQDPITYTVYFGTDPDPTDVLAADLPDTTAPVPVLEPGHTYYWSVAATDGMGAESTRSTWSFSTHVPSGHGYVLVASYGARGSGPGEFEVVRDVALDARGHIYASDLNNARVQIFSRPEVYLGNITLAGATPFQSPYGLATDAQGALLVTDQNNHRVAKFDSAGAYIWSIGGRGTGNGQFQFPRDVCADDSDNLYVLDTGNHRVQKFDPNGVYLGQWGGRGTASGEFDTPYGLAVAQGSVFVADSFNRRIQKFSDTGVFSGSWGGFGTGSVPGAIAADASGNVFVLKSDGVVHKFDSEGLLLSTWGDGDIGNPADGLWVDPAGNLVWIADTYQHRILVFERQ